MYKYDQIYKAVCRRLLREGQQEIDLGKIVFSPHRSDGVPTDEPDTPDEEGLYGELLTWVGSARFDEEELTVPMLRKLMLHPEYKDFFVPPREGATLFRGISSVPINKVEGWLSAGGQHEALEAFRKGPRKGHVDTSLIVKTGISPAASWTYNEWIALKKFAEVKDDPGSDKCDLVFEASTDDNFGAFLDLSKIQAVVPSIKFAGEDEMEVIALRHVTLSGMQWRKSRWREKQ